MGLVGSTRTVNARHDTGINARVWVWWGSTCTVNARHDTGINAHVWVWWGSTCTVNARRDTGINAHAPLENSCSLRVEKKTPQRSVEL